MQNNENRPETAQGFAYERKGNSAVIWRCFSHDRNAVIPAELDGYPVTELAPYAFSAHMDQAAFEKARKMGKLQFYVPKILYGQSEAETQQQENGIPSELGPVLCGDALEELVLPPSIRRVGRYCFYNCSNLRSLSFWSSLEDWGSGVFTGSHKISQMCVHVIPEQPSSLKQVLDEIYEVLYTRYVLENSSDIASLVFPEYYVEGVENTPARILEEHIHGTGMKYRNCFKGKEFDFRQYDSLFAHAVVQEPEKVVGKLAVGRLRYPYQLLQEAKEQYMNYVQEHAGEIADWMLEEQDMDAFRWLLTVIQKSEAVIARMTETAARLHNAESASLLMEACRSKEGSGEKRKRQRLEL